MKNIFIGVVFTLSKSNKFICSKTLNDEIILVAKNTKEFANVINIADLRTLPLLYADTGDSFISYIEDLLHQKLHFQLSIDQILEIIDYLREGFGYAFVLKSLVLVYINKGELKEVIIENHPSPTLESYLLIDKSKAKKESVEYFVRLIDSHAGF